MFVFEMHGNLKSQNRLATQNCHLDLYACMKTTTFTFRSLCNLSVLWSYSRVDQELAYLQYKIGPHRMQSTVKYHTMNSLEKEGSYSILHPFQEQSSIENTLEANSITKILGVTYAQREIPILHKANRLHIVESKLLPY